MAVKNFYSAVNYWLLAEEVLGSSFYGYADDELGSSVAMFDVTGRTVGAMRYTPFGLALTSSGIGGTSAFGWLGTLGYRTNPRDFAQIYVRRRTYSPSAGMWVSVDANWPNESAYHYAGNNPVTYQDPTGNWKALIVTGRYGLLEGYAANVGISYMIAYLKGVGATEFVRLDNPTQDELVQALTDPDVQGFGYLGHGITLEQRKEGVPWTSVLQSGELIDASAIQRALQRRFHKIHYGIIFSCNSGASAPDWNKLISVVGTYDVSVGLFTPYMTEPNFTSGGSDVIPHPKPRHLPRPKPRQGPTRKGKPR